MFFIYEALIFYCWNLYVISLAISKYYSRSSIIAPDELSIILAPSSGCPELCPKVMGPSFPSDARFPNSCILTISIANTWAGREDCSTCSRRAGWPHTTMAFAKCSTPLSKSPLAIRVSPSWISCTKYLKGYIRNELDAILRNYECNFCKNTSVHFVTNFILKRKTKMNKLYYYISTTKYFDAA